MKVPYPGTRFVHTSEGRCLITRVAPCPACLADAQLEHEPHHDHDKHFAQVGDLHPSSISYSLRSVLRNIYILTKRA